jgi:hypothetical protein
MNTAGKVGIIAGVLAVVGIGGGTIYDLEEKKKCAAAGGTWNGLFKGCTMPTTTPSPTSTTSTTPDPVDESSINITWGTATADSVPGTLTWGLSTAATSYTVGVNDQTQTVSAPPVAITATPSDSVSVSIEACN